MRITIDIPKKKKSYGGETEKPAAKGIVSSPRADAFDPNGSWTGIPADSDPHPVQDADDL